MPQIACIESLDQDGRGIAHVDGKVIFVDGALPRERVEYSVYRRKPSYEQAQTMRVLESSSDRVFPSCKHFGVCGGCAMQHFDPVAQVAVKQRVLEDNLRRIGKTSPGRILPPIHGAYWGYRTRARLSARYVEKKQKLLLGFHEKRSSFVADLASCEILSPQVSALMEPLRSMIEGLSVRSHLPQVEVAVGDAVTVLVLRLLDRLSADDETRLRDFADRHGIQFWLQPKGPDSASPFYPEHAPELAYRLPEFDLVMPFRPTDFTQVNPAINALLVARAMHLLDPQPGEVIADLFCGLGNFSLPIARSGARVVGIEAARSLVERATANAERNGLAGLTQFRVADLFGAAEAALSAPPIFDKVLIDPPRDGAIEAIKALPDPGPLRIVYVSCNPATLARDAAVLVHSRGYSLKAAGIVNMFPHTAHVESIAVFER